MFDACFQIHILQYISYKLSDKNVNGFVYLKWNSSYQIMPIWCEDNNASEHKTLQSENKQD